MKVKVKPTAGGPLLELDLNSGDATVADAKASVLAQRPELGDVRLIYRGQILKDERTLASYGEFGVGGAGGERTRARARAV